MVSFWLPGHCGIVLVIIIICYYLVKIYKINHSYNSIYTTRPEIGLRKFPFPYRCALAICNDIDDTRTNEEFLQIQEFLNTTGMTEMGPGIDLEIGNSFYMYDKKQRDSFAYFSSNHFDKVVIRKFIKSGYLDCLHSYGEGYEDRDCAINSIKEFQKYNIKIKVWVNHDRSRSNLGNWFATNQGDQPESRFYHADATISYGFKFFWLGSTTNIIGQCTPITLMTFVRSFDTSFFFKSLRNCGIAFVKHLLSVFDFKKKYAMHAGNDLVRIVSLTDGQRVYEFMRYDNHPGGIGAGASSKGTAYNISTRILEKLKKCGGYGILYTHFGKNDDCSEVIAEETRTALRHLHNQYQAGAIYVTTTGKLLNYYLIHKYLKWSHHTINNDVIIQIHDVEDPVFGTFVPTLEDLSGITFYIPFGKNARVFIKDLEITNIHKNPVDFLNKTSVSIPLTYLKYKG